VSEHAARIKVLVVDDHPVVREGLKMLLGGAEDVAVVGEAATGSDAIAAANRAAPDVILLDLDLAGDDGLSYVAALQSSAANARVIVLTGVRDRARHEAALLAGARGLVVKDRPAEVLLKAVRKVHEGELWFDRAMLEAVVQRSIFGARASDPETGKIASLTDREREVVALIGEGLRNEEIGRRLFISEKTVRNHLSTIFEKLGVSDRLELVVYAFRHGVVSARR
jgi:two-component system, NarL family, nitrate/nitrite response regulator NarL